MTCSGRGSPFTKTLKPFTSTMSPGRPITRLTQFTLNGMLSSCLSRSGSLGLPGYLKTMMSPRRISRWGRSGKVGPGAKTNLLTKRWSPTVIVFSMDAVGTLTAWTTNVIPNRAIMTVTTADSKYSRITDFGGPTSFSFSFSIFASPSRPFDRTGRGVNRSGLLAVSLSVVVTESFIDAIVDAQNLYGQANPLPQKPTMSVPGTLATG